MTTRTAPRLDHLISIEDLDRDMIVTILDTAEQLREIATRPIKKVPTLRGKTVCNLFLEDSTRTRISFDIAPLPRKVTITCQGPAPFCVAAVSWGSTTAAPVGEVISQVEVRPYIPFGQEVGNTQ